MDHNNIDRVLDQYRKQVLRWNDQINLVSRKDTAGQLDGLIQQCRDGWDRLDSAGISDLAGATRIWYFDLGSGAGLPGIVWHAQMTAANLPLWTLLVEPRDKRAWFLERVGRQVGPESLHVAANRWGDTGTDILTDKFSEPRPSHILISLKALHLPDSAVLEGLKPFLEVGKKLETSARDETTLLIVRFYPPEQEWNQDLAGKLDILPQGRERSASSHLFRSEGGQVLQPATLPGASLVLSEYRILTP